MSLLSGITVYTQLTQNMRLYAYEINYCICDNQHTRIVLLCTGLSAEIEQFTRFNVKEALPSTGRTGLQWRYSCIDSRKAVAHILLTLVAGLAPLVALVRHILAALTTFVVRLETALTPGEPGISINTFALSAERWGLVL